MTPHDETPADAAERRGTADAIAPDRAGSPEALPAISPEDARRAIDELRRLRAERETQDETLRRLQADLTAERERILAFCDEAPMAYVTLSDSDVILHGNLAASTLLGVARGALVGLPFSRFVFADARDASRRFCPPLDDPDAPTTWELRMRKHDGTPFWAQLVATAGRGEGGAPVCRLVMSDVTERTRAEEALRETNELFSLFMRHSPIYAYIKTVTPTESRVLQASDNYQQMIGLSSAEMVGRTMAELFPADLAAGMTADDWAVAATGHVLTVEEQLNGRSYTSIKFPIVQGDRTLLAGYTIDVTERLAAEEAVRASDARHRAILRTAMDGFWVVDMQGRLLDVNETYARMSGYSTQELLALRIADLDATESIADTIAHNERIREQGADRFEARHRRKDGTLYDVEVSAQYQPDGGGRCVGFLRDITARKHAEAERGRLEAQLQQAQKMESVGRLAGGVAHDFNNMLGVILGHTELALEQVDPAQPIHDDLTEIRAAASRSADLTRQLLAFARRQTVAPKVLDLNDTVGTMLTMLRRLIGEDIDLLWVPCRNPWPIKVDPSQIDQVLANLCVNARDAIAGVGKVTIETANAAFDEAYCAAHPGYVPGEYVRLAVSDNGCGMGPDTVSHLFEPFFTTKAMGRGTGLGLATVYGIVKQNHGFVNVYSEPEMGTTFTLYLPRHAGEGGRPGSVGVAEPASRGHETILLVEDDPAVLRMTTRMLGGLGYTVLAARSPAEAIRLAHEHAAEVHLLMTDVVMPEMNGRDLAATLLARYPRLERLFTSGYTADVIAHHGVLDDGVHFLQKPFSIHDLAAKVREALSRD
jgi:PAS domain S-box-containing protein